MKGHQIAEIPKEVSDVVLTELKSHFRPEFLNRVDDTVLFKPLSKSELSDIIDLLTDSLKIRLEQQDLSLEIMSDVKDYIAEQAYEPAFGARPLKRYLQQHIETPIAKLIIKGALPENHTIVVEMKNNAIEEYVKK